MKKNNSNYELRYASKGTVITVPPGEQIPLTKALKTALEELILADRAAEAQERAYQAEQMRIQRLRYAAEAARATASQKMSTFFVDLMMQVGEDAFMENRGAFQINMEERAVRYLPRREPEVGMPPLPGSPR